MNYIKEEIEFVLDYALTQAQEHIRTCPVKWEPNSEGAHILIPFYGKCEICQKAKEAIKVIERMQRQNS